MAELLAGLAALAATTTVLAWLAVRRWFALARRHSMWMGRWRLAPEQCAACGRPPTDAVHVPAHLEPFRPQEHRYQEARVVPAPGPGPVHPVGRERW